ncbi:MAG: hypothetical protein E7047_04870 [Lentisphaerae bacterium]|nr:hypothetical protein [Lentisphaerota bacterium]
MLKSLTGKSNIDQHAVRIADAVYPQLFAPELEFNAPARGMWNIVHTCMLIPETHQIFICAQGCLRGVILTAGEMNAMHRMSFVAIREHELFDGSLEESAIEGVTAILNKMEKLPRAVAVFFSCVQLFAGCDLKAVIKELSARFPAVDFFECLMHPTMRKSALTPDAFMRKQMYGALKAKPVQKRSIAIIGNDRATAESSELILMLKQNGFVVRDITYCRNYDEYLELGSCEYFLCYHTVAQAGCKVLSDRLQRRMIYLPLSYSFEEIKSNYQLLSDTLGLDLPDLTGLQSVAEAELQQTCKYLNNMPVAIDYTATLRNLSLARLLLTHGFNVKRVYSDVVIGEEAADFEFLQTHYPDLMIYPTVHPAMRFAVQKPGSGDEFLCIGQKAACFTGSRHLVNIVSGGGWYGFDGIRQLCAAMRQAKDEFSDTEELIQLKGWGCASCL